ncbi:uncharacterized protein LOC142339868 [Convolutriloba macropyga]|uniref:uncharacterized protein LOC142339868 n=1 Tax=Convolutriloba macropyga TaxID=536237 RepID=UPI003F51F0BE
MTLSEIVDRFTKKFEKQIKVDSEADEKKGISKGSIPKEKLVTGLAFVGFGSLWLGLGFMAGLSRAKRKSKDQLQPPSTSIHPNTFMMKEDGVKLARRALAYGSLAAIVGVASSVIVTCYALEIRSIQELRDISQAATRSRNWK